MHRDSHKARKQHDLCASSRLVRVIFDHIANCHPARQYRASSHLATTDEMRFEYKDCEQEMETPVKASQEMPLVPTHTQAAEQYRRSSAVTCVVRHRYV
jgi:hypothetical protein